MTFHSELSNNRMSQSNIFYSLLALVAAILFGISAPLSKLLLGEIDPVTSAALLYLGSGLGITHTIEQLNSLVKSKGNPLKPD